jgi:septum formation protein
MRPQLILASASPRRRRLLAEAGYDFEVAPSDVTEPEPEPGADPATYAAELAWRKAAAVARRFWGAAALILSADTVGAVDGLILNKPTDRDDAERMIRLQEGRESDVLTALCLFRVDRLEWAGAVEASVVRFRTMDDAERTAFLDSNRWQGKAGAYGVQDHDPFVAVVRGSFSNVVGLPLERLDALLRGHPGLTS